MTLASLVNVVCAALSFIFILSTTVRTVDGYSLVLTAFIFSLIGTFIADRIIKLNNKSSKPTFAAPANQFLILKFPFNILLCVSCIVALNKFIPIANTTQTKAQVNGKTLDKYGRGPDTFYVDLDSDDYGQQRLRIKRMVWDSLRVDDEVNITAQKGLFGYYLVHEVNTLTHKD